jgi:uncharacterized protein YjbJ (UPF0337 family)
MNKKEISGAGRELKGKVEKGIGKATGNTDTQAHGMAEETKGKVEKKVGQLEGKAKDLANAIKD